MAITLCGLYAVTDSTLSPGEKLFTDVAAALRGGARIIQFRDKSDDSTWRDAAARKLLTLCEHHQALLLINDDVDLCERVGAHGVHLGRGDGDLAEARERLGADAVIGATCHDSLEFAREAAPYATYLAFGAFYPSSTKPDAKAARRETLTSARELGLPLVAIGGITLDNASPILTAGADMLAVVSGLFAAPDIEARALAFSRLFGSDI